MKFSNEGNIFHLNKIIRKYGIRLQNIRYLCNIFECNIIQFTHTFL